MYAIFRTRCGCSQVLTVPEPPPDTMDLAMEHPIPTMAALAADVVDDKPLERRTFRYMNTHRRRDYGVVAEYLEV